MIRQAGGEQYGAFTLRYAFRHVGDWHKVQDLVQEIWLAAWQARDRFVGQSTKQTWLLSILRHKVLDHFRVASRGQPLSEKQSDRLNGTGYLNSHTWPAAQLPAWMAPSRQLERKQLRTLLDRCLCRMTDRVKAVFAFCDLDELPHR
uniref:RNA polymerase sigma factor n=1 Tax=Nitrospira cf. moscoviensis SBR1015 TaxID=96242 RepID=UPI000B3BB8FE|nr:sigma-70 family RNA polymerase sigma factor [Nitrospira cf. moscoviensis SBR1015]